MNPQAFEALCELTRAAPGSPSMRAARQVLTQGARAVDAAEAQGLSAHAVRKAVARLRAAHALARIAAR